MLTTTIPLWMYWGSLVAGGLVGFGAGVWFALKFRGKKVNR